MKINLIKRKSKNILVINVGSSSLKFALFEKNKKNDLSILTSGKYERIGSSKSCFISEDANKTITIKKRIPNYNEAVKKLTKLLKEKDFSFDIIAHRVVHGGKLNKVSKINKKVEKIIHEFSVFAPLHNPYELEVIKIFKKFKKPQYAVFDTSFYSTLPEKAYVYPIPLKLSKKFNLRRYGFHGTSHKFVSEGLKGKTITCHLGNGSSITAIKDGIAIDNTLGLTPLEGLMMATRSGDLDPGLVLFLESKGYDMNKILNFESGFKAFSKYTDLRDILKRLDNKKIKLAFEIFIYRIIKYIGAYSATLNGLDNLVFTAGIGENIPIIREKICENLYYLGVKIDKKANQMNKEIISLPSSKIKIYVKKTNEEFIIAKEVSLK